MATKSNQKCNEQCWSDMSDGISDGIIRNPKEDKTKKNFHPSRRLETFLHVRLFKAAVCSYPAAWFLCPCIFDFKPLRSIRSCCSQSKKSNRNGRQQQLTQFCIHCGNRIFCLIYIYTIVNTFIFIFLFSVLEPILIIKFAADVTINSLILESDPLYFCL